MPHIVGLLRIRNEEYIIRDTLNHLASFCNGGIVVYDDCSTDSTVDICEKHPAVLKIIKGITWDNLRERAEFENRAALLKKAKEFAAVEDWFVYLDADERIEFQWEILNQLPPEVVGIRMKLFDFYITNEDIEKHYTERKWLGPEYRSILMVFRNLPTLAYHCLDQREVDLGSNGRVIVKGYVKHYGKAISVEQWESTCDYYTNYFSKYSEKWKKRKGKAIHTVSDFGFPLIQWSDKEHLGFPMEKITMTSSNTLQDPWKKLKILITNHHLMDFTGSEILTFTLAENLAHNNNQVTVYSKYLGHIENWFIQKNIRVVNNLESISNETFDIIHVHHNISAIEVRFWFPNTPIVFYSQGLLPFLEQPPIINTCISKYIAISEEVQENLLSYGIDKDQVEIIRNMIDVEKFSMSRNINLIPQNVLVISGRLDESKESVIKEACSELGLKVDLVGGRFGTVDQTFLKEKIEWADIIFSLGRGAIEGMISGRAVIIYDYLGGDGLITPENYFEIRKNNFSGRRYSYDYNKTDLVNEIRKFSLKNVQEIQKLAIEDYSAKNLMKQLFSIYANVINSYREHQFVMEDYALIKFANNIIYETYNYAYEIGLRKGKYESKSTAFNYLIELAEDLIIDKHNDIAKRILTLILSKDNSNISALNNLSVINIIEEKHEEAVNIIKKVLNIDPGNSVASGNLEFIKQILHEKYSE